MHYAAKAAAFSRLYPGAVSALGALREAGVPLGLCTNKPEATAPAHALGADGVIDHLDELPRALARFAARER